MESGFLDIVDRNQIDMTEHSFEQGGKLLRLTWIVIDTADQRILIGDAAMGLISVILAGLHQLFNRVTMVDRHDFIPYLVVGGVQRY